MDLDAIRNALSDARRAAGRDSVEDFAIELGVDKTTVYRIEQHQTQPKLELVARWLSITSGESLGAFFSRLESGVRPVTAPVTVPPQTQPGGLDGSGIARHADAGDIRLLQRVAIAILHLVGAPELPQPDQPVGPDKPETR